MTILIKEHEKFQKDLKKLQKRYPSLTNDLEDFKKILVLNPQKHEQIQGLGKDVFLPVYKVRHFVCESLKSTTKLRLIYVYDENNGKIEFIEFLEIYAKADKPLEDRDRIQEYFKNNNK